MPMHASSVLILCVYVYYPPPPGPTLVSLTCETCVNVFVLELF